jgi:hypothetical protein
MAYGIEVRGQNNELLFSDGTPCVVLWGKVSLGGGSTTVQTFTTNAPNFPIVFAHGGNPVGVVSVLGSAGNWSVTVTGGSVTLYIFCRIPNVAQNTGWGLNTYDASSLTFSTNYRVLRIVGRKVLNNSSMVQNLDFGTIPDTYAVSCPYVGFRIVAYGCYGIAFKLAARRYNASQLELYITTVSDNLQVPAVFNSEAPFWIQNQLVLFINPSEYD